MAPRTPESLEQEAREAAEWLDQLDPATTTAENPRDLRRIGLAKLELAAAERKLSLAVLDARDQGRSWAQIALVLGMSTKDAQERFIKGEILN